MGVHDGSHKIENTNDQYIKKREDIDMHNRRIDNLKTICMTNSTNNLKYAINMECLINYTINSLSETLFWEYYQQATAFYKIDTANSHELTFDSVRSVSKLFDQSLSQSNAEQTTYNLQPTICTKANRINNRYYLEFDGSKKQRMISDINLNASAGEEDIINIFIVYYIDSFGGSYWTRCGLYGADNGGFDAFTSFSPHGDLIVSKTTNDHIVIGKSVTNGRSPIADFQNKANAGEIGKWICLSVHWNIPSETSYVYCNGKKLTDFTSRSSIGSTQMTFGDLNPSSIAPFFGKIASFLLYKNKRMSKHDILIHHKVLCKWYGVDHDEIIF